MKHFSILLLMITVVSCNFSKKQELAAPTGSTLAGKFSTFKADTVTDYFHGEYRAGDSSWFITPIKMAFEMRTSPHGTPTVLFFQQAEQDGVSVYATEDELTGFKMYPGHEEGVYFEKDKEWPVKRIQPAEKKEPEK